MVVHRQCNSLSYTLVLSLVYYLTSAMFRDAKFNLCDSEIVQASARLIVEFHGNVAE